MPLDPLASYTLTCAHRYKIFISKQKKILPPNVIFAGTIISEFYANR